MLEREIQSKAIELDTVFCYLIYIFISYCFVLKIVFFLFELIHPWLSTGEGGLEVRSDGVGQVVPVDLHPGGATGYSWHHPPGTHALRRPPPHRRGLLRDPGGRGARHGPLQDHSLAHEYNLSWIVYGEASTWRTPPGRHHSTHWLPQMV